MTDILNLLRDSNPVPATPAYPSPDLQRHIDRARAAGAHPVRPVHLHRPNRRRLVVLAASTTSLVALVLLPVTSSQPSAFASWTAVPQSSSAQDIAAIDRFCHKTGLPAAAVRRVIDRRGDVAFVVYGDEGGLTTCAAQRTPLSADDSGLPWNVGSANELRPVQHRGKGRPIAIESIEGSGFPQGFTQSTVGWAVPGVAQVIVQTADRKIVATLADDGLFTAWWPHLPTQTKQELGGLDPFTVTGYDATGSAVGVEHFPLTSGERQLGYDDGVAGG